MRKQLSKLNDTVFYLESLDFEECGAFIPVKMLNQARREIVDRLYEEKLQSKPRRVIGENALTNDGDSGEIVGIACQTGLPNSADHQAERVESVHQAGIASNADHQAEITDSAHRRGEHRICTAAIFDSIGCNSCTVRGMPKSRYTGNLL